MLPKSPAIAGMEFAFSPATSPCADMSRYLRAAPSMAFLLAASRSGPLKQVCAWAVGQRISQGTMARTAPRNPQVNDEVNKGRVMVVEFRLRTNFAAQQNSNARSLLGLE